MTASTDDFVLFPDTNTLLHYPSISSVDWKTLCAAKTIRIVLCMQVIHELDTKKDDSRLRDRAARVIKEADTLIDAGGAITDGVTLEVFNYEIRAADFPDTLSPDSKDDRIVHSVKRYLQQNRDTKVAVYSEDMGMRLRCKANGLEVMKPDASTRLPDPASEQEKKYKAAITELNEVKNRTPKVDLLLSTFGAITTPQEVPRYEIPPMPADRNIDAEFDEYVRMKQLRPLATDGFSRVSRTSPPIASMHNAIDRYNSKLTLHLDEYRQWLELRRALEIAKSQTLGFSMWLTNQGNMPAEDLDAEIEFPRTVCRITAENDETETFDLPAAPQPPERPRQLFVDDGTLHRMVPIERPFPAIERFDPFKAFENLTVTVTQDGQGGPFRIAISCKRLKQHDPICIGNFFATLSDDALKSFIALYRMSVANLAKPVEGKLSFIVQRL